MKIFGVCTISLLKCDSELWMLDVDEVDLFPNSKLGSSTRVIKLHHFQVVNVWRNYFITSLFLKSWIGSHPSGNNTWKQWLCQVPGWLYKLTGWTFHFTTCQHIIPHKTACFGLAITVYIFFPILVQVLQYLLQSIDPTNQNPTNPSTQPLRPFGENRQQDENWSWRLKNDKSLD